MTPARPFTIGLSPLGDRPWLIADNRLPAYRARKHELRALYPERVFSAEAETGAVQQEALELIAGWFAANAPRHVPAEPADGEPLERAGLMTAEDLVIMRKGEGGWRIAAASLHFPSSWSLAAKFARPLAEVHAPVPGFGPETRNATVIERIFDNLDPAMPVLRENWSVYGDDELHHPLSGHGEGGDRFAGATPETLWLREERQTLTKLATTGDILFTIFVSLTNLAELGKTAEARERASAIARQTDAMTADQLAYKGMATGGQSLSALLDRLAAGTGPVASGQGHGPDSDYPGETPRNKVHDV